MSRTILIILAVPVFVVVMAALLLPLLFDEQDILRMAARAVKEETGATLAVNGEANLSIFPTISVDLSDTEVTLAGEEEPSIRARFLGIGIEFMPLLSGNVKVGEVAVDGLLMSIESAPAEEAPPLETAGLSDAELDAYYEERRKRLESAGRAAGAEAVAAAPLALSVKRLLVTDSIVESISAETGERSRVELINLEATDLNLDNVIIPITMKLRLEQQGNGSPIDVSIAARLGIDGAGQKIRIEDVALEVLGATPEPLAVRATGDLDIARSALDLQLNLTLGDTRGDGQLRFASFESPQIDTKLHLNLFDPALLVVVAPEASVEAAADKSAGQGSDKAKAATGNTAQNGPAEAAGDQPLPLDAIRSIDTRAFVLVDRANFSGHVIETLDVKLRAVDGVIRINQMTGQLHGGKIDMKAVFDGKHNVAQLRTNGGVTQLDLAKALKAMESEPIASGLANLEWNLKSSGSTANQLIAAMQGPIVMHTREVTLESLGVEKMLCEAVALANRESMAKQLPERTQFQALSVDLNMSDGKLKMSPLRAELTSVKLSGQGEMDLLKQDFSATITARMSAGMAKLDPACRVNERITGIGWPVNCRGSLVGNPADWCSVDSEKIIRDLATKEVQNKVEKEAGRLLEKLFK